MNTLLQRQIEKSLGSLSLVGPAWGPLCPAISDAYDGFDADRRLIERSLDISSQELTEIDQRLRQEIDERKDADRQLERMNKELSDFACIVSHDQGQGEDRNEKLQTCAAG